MTAIGTPDLGVRFVETGYDDVKRKVDSMSQSIRGAVPAVEQMDKATKSSALNMKQLSFAVFGASLSVTGLVIGFSRLDKAYLNVEKTRVAIAKSTNTLATQELRYNLLVEKGQGTTERARITLSKMAATKEDLRVKTEQLNIEVTDIRDTYINLAASLASSVFFTVSSLITVMKNVSGETIKAGFATVFLRRSQEGAVGSSSAMTAANIRLSFANVRLAATNLGVAATFRAVAVAIKTVLASIGPIGWAIIGAATAYELYANNVFGVQTEINKLLGIESEEVKMQRLLKDSIGDTGEEWDLLTDTTQGAKEGIRSMLPTQQALADAFAGITAQVKGATKAINENAQAVDAWISGGGVAGAPGAKGSVIDQIAAKMGVPKEMIGPPSATTVLDRIILSAAREKEIRDAINTTLDAAADKERAILLLRSEFLQLYPDQFDWANRLLIIEEHKLRFEKESNTEKKKRLQMLKEEAELEERLAKKKRENLRELALALGFGGTTPAMEGIPNMARFLASLGAGLDEDIADLMELAGIRGLPFMDEFGNVVPGHVLSTKILEGARTPGFSGQDRMRQALAAARLSGQAGVRRTMQGVYAKARAAAAKHKAAGIKSRGGGGGARGRSGGHSANRMDTSGGRWRAFMSFTAPQIITSAVAQGVSEDIVAQIFRQSISTETRMVRGAVPGARSRGQSSTTQVNVFDSAKFNRLLAAQIEYARNVTELSEREVLLSGFEAQKSREERFLAHIEQFGAQSVMGGGGTSLETDISGLTTRISEEINRLFMLRERQQALEMIGVVKLR